MIDVERNFLDRIMDIFFKIIRFTFEILFLHEMLRKFF